MLDKPEDGEPLFLYLVVSKNGEITALVKEQDGAQHLVYYLIKSLLDVEARYLHLEKIILSFVCASAKLCHYFETHPIYVKINYPIKNVIRKLEMSGRMAKWYAQLSTYDLTYEAKFTIKSQTLKNFMADFNPDIQPRVEKEVQWLQDIEE